MFTRNFAFALLTLVLLSISNSIQSQPKSSFVEGSIRLANSDLMHGYIWISNTLEGDQIIYYKEEPRSNVIKYYPDDVLTIDLRLKEAKYVSESIIVDEYYKRAILQVHFKGEFDFLSYYNPKINIYYLVDRNDQFIELLNTFERPNRGNDYKLTYKQEYKETLIENLGGNPSILKLIQYTNFDPKEICNLLIKYHKLREIDYETFPPRRFSGFSYGFGSEISTVSHTSDINENFKSQSPFIGGIVRGGLQFFDKKFDLSFILKYNYGIISHDDNFSSSNFLTAFYEDVIRASILSEGFGATLKPYSIDKLTLCLSGGVFYSQFLNYSREVTEELFYEIDGVVVNNFLDNFSKPDPYFSANLGGGLEYGLNKSTSISLNYSYSMVFESNSGNNNFQSISIMINKSFY